MYDYTYEIKPVYENTQSPGHRRSKPCSLHTSDDHKHTNETMNQEQEQEQEQEELTVPPR